MQHVDIKHVIRNKKFFLIFLYKSAINKNRLFILTASKDSMFILSSLLLLLNFCGDASDSQKVKNSDTSIVSESPVVISEDLQTATEEMTPSESTEEEPELPIAQRVSPVDQNGSLMEQRWFRPVFVAVTLGIFFISGKLFFDRLVRGTEEDPVFKRKIVPETLKQRDYYEVLGVDKYADTEEIKRVYRRLARKYHPDVNKEAGADERFKEINRAYEVLSNPTDRAKYDRWGHGFPK
jgi:preprotein translocase subunit Sec63